VSFSECGLSPASSFLLPCQGQTSLCIAKHVLHSREAVISFKNASLAVMHHLC